MSCLPVMIRDGGQCIGGYVVGEMSVNLIALCHCMLRSDVGG